MILKKTLYTFWLVIGLYFGIGGYVVLDHEEKKLIAEKLPENIVMHDDIEFRNVEVVEIYKSEKKASLFFTPIMKFLPKNMIYLFTAMAFGILGVITRITKEITIDKIPFREVEVSFFPILGMMIGLLILAISHILPNLLVKSEENLQPLALSFFSLIAGFGARQFYSWLMDSSSKIFGKESVEEE